MFHQAKYYFRLPVLAFSRGSSDITHAWELCSTGVSFTLCILNDCLQIAMSPRDEVGRLAWYLASREAGIHDAILRARDLFDELSDSGMNLDTLSMDMTADLETAVACGSTLVRVGTGLFGPRP